MKFIKVDNFQLVHIVTNRFFRNHSVNPIVKWEREGARKGLNATSGARFASLTLGKVVRCQNLPIIVLIIVPIA